MKSLRIIVPALLFLLVIQCTSSKRIINEDENLTEPEDIPAFTHTGISHQSSSDIYPSFLSNYAMLFVEDLAKETSVCDLPANFIPSAKLINRYPIEIMKDSIFCVSGFLDVAPNFKLDNLKRLGIQFIQGDYPFSTAIIPLKSICKLLQLKGIKRFELSRKAVLLLNVARPAVNAEILLRPEDENKRYNGKGIIMGIVDYGFDYGHPNFYDSTGDFYRVTRVWEQQNHQGNPPSGFGYGTEMQTREVILAAKTDTDLETHGTHVAGIAAGSGASTEYYGLAPGSELVLVSTNRTDAGIADGLRYIAKYAESQGKPCVINFSLGSNVGPHDGTSAFDRLCENQSKPGLIFVGAAGNDGNQPIYISKKFEPNSNDTIIQTAIISKGNADDIVADFWGSSSTKFGATVMLFDTLKKKIVANAPFYYALTDSQKIQTFRLNADSASYIVQIGSEVSVYNQKPTMMVQINLNNGGPHLIPVVRVTCKDGFVEGWSSYGVFSDLGNPDFQPGSTDHTVNEIGGTGKKIISAGAFCTKNVWQTPEGLPYHYGENAILGDIADFSSKGPTADGRIKPDISCPGYGVVSSFSRFFNGTYPPAYYKVMEIPFDDENYYFGILQGTSESAPVVSGTIALWLEENPALTVDEALEIIRKTAIPAPVGPRPNNVWGWGILNAGAGMQHVVNQLSSSVSE